MPTRPALRATLTNRPYLLVLGLHLLSWAAASILVAALVNFADYCLPVPDSAGSATRPCAVEPFRHTSDPDLILFAESEGETVGWLPCIPNLNEVLFHVSGLPRPRDYA